MRILVRSHLVMGGDTVNIQAKMSMLFNDLVDWEWGLADVLALDVVNHRLDVMVLDNMMVLRRVVVALYRGISMEVRT